jgi:hypothetical protein
MSRVMGVGWMLKVVRAVPNLVDTAIVDREQVSTTFDARRSFVRVNFGTSTGTGGDTLCVATPPQGNRVRVFIIF